MVFVQQPVLNFAPSYARILLCDQQSKLRFSNGPVQALEISKTFENSRKLCRLDSTRSTAVLVLTRNTADGNESTERVVVMAANP